MKLALGTLVAACAVALIWTFVARDGAADRSLPTLANEAETLVAVPADGTLPDRGEGDGATRIEALAPTTGDEATDSIPREDTRAGNVLARAVTEAGKSISGAWLLLRQMPERSVRAAADGRLALAVDGAALERLAALDGSRRIEIRVGAAGYRTRYLRAPLTEGSSMLEMGDVTLVPGGVLHGRVVDETGLGVEGALVAFGMPVKAEPGDPDVARGGPGDLDPAPWSGKEPAIVGTSGLGGAFRLEGLPVGYGTAWARTDTSLWAFSEPIGVRAGEEVAGIELVVRAAPDEVITGEVVDPDGEPLPGLELTFTETGSSAGWFTGRTEARGRFFFVPRGGARQDIVARSPSWEWEDQERTGVAAGTHGLVIAFERSSWLHVEVRDPDGTPVRSGRVTGVSGEGPTDRRLLRCESPLDTDGRGRLRRPDAALRVRVEGWGYRAVLLGPFDPGLFPDPLLVTLEPVPALVGRVLLPDGYPAAGARVSLHQGATQSSGVVQAPGASAPAERFYLSHQGWSGDRDAFVYELMVDPAAEVTADERGRYRLPLPGVNASAEGEVESPAGGLAGFGWGGSPSQRLARAKPDRPWYVHAAVDGEATVTSGPHVFEPTRDTELELRLPAGGAIAGRLVLEDGASPVGWTACASDGLAEVAAAPVGPDGLFRFGELHAGAWQVRVFEPDQRYPCGGGRMRTDRAPEPDVVVVAGRTSEYEHVAGARASARLMGRLWIDGAPPGPFKVIVRTATRQASITSYETTLDPDGRFELTLEPGLSTSLGIYGTVGGSDLRLSAKVTVATSDNDWSFDFETARIEGRVDPARVPESAFGGAVYEVEHGSITLRSGFEPDAEGRFGPVVVPAGPGILRGPREGFRDPGATWTELELEPGETRVLDVR